MEFLIIEDGNEKVNELQSILTDCGHKFQIVKTEKEAKRILKEKNFDMVLLDMELPISVKSEINMNKFSGITIMNSMKCYNNTSPVLLITQYNNFIDMTTEIEGIVQTTFVSERKSDKREVSNVNLRDIKFLEQLHHFMNERYSNYIGAIYYSNVSNEWKKNLLYFIDKIGGNCNEGISS